MTRALAGGIAQAAWGPWVWLAADLSALPVYELAAFPSSTPVEGHGAWFEAGSPDVLVLRGELTAPLVVSLTVEIDRVLFAPILCAAVGLDVIRLYHAGDSYVCVGRFPVDAQRLRGLLWRADSFATVARADREQA